MKALTNTGTTGLSQILRHYTTLHNTTSSRSDQHTSFPHLIQFNKFLETSMLSILKVNTVFKNKCHQIKYINNHKTQHEM